MSPTRLCGYGFRLLPALVNAMATACLIAFFLVGGWLLPIDPSFFQSSTSVLILLLTTDWLAPFLSGMMFILVSESLGALTNRRGDLHEAELVTALAWLAPHAR